jgi:uncharacterized membrane protein
MTEPAARVATATWVKVVLALSLALNLAIIGLAAGAWMKEGSKGPPRDLSFGPFSEALSRADRRALRSALLERAPDFRASREAAAQEFAALLTALRAQPLDPAALRTAFAAIEQRNAGRLELGRSLIENRLIEMSDADRLAFADRLEAGLKHKARPEPRPEP